MGCAGLMLSRIGASEPVYVAYLTDGAGSHPGHPEINPPKLSAIRAEEARASAVILGVPERNLTFFNAPDGGLPHLGEEARIDLVRRIGELGSKIAAAEVYVTAAEDGSSEHAAANALVREAVASLPDSRPRILEYPIWARWNPLRLKAPLRKAAHVYRQPLSAGEVTRKNAAINSFRSQIVPIGPWSHAPLPPGFVGLFGCPEEFFFEY